jgi:hypothetical protein
MTARSDRVSKKILERLFFRGRLENFYRETHPDEPSEVPISLPGFRTTFSIYAAL